MPKGKRGGNNNPTGKGGAKKGEVRNPHGRPKLGFAISDLLRQEGDEIVELSGVKMTKTEALVKQIYALAIGGYLPAMIRIMEQREPLEKLIKNQKAKELEISREDRQKRIKELIEKRKNGIN